MSYYFTNADNEQVSVESIDEWQLLYKTTALSELNYKYDNSSDSEQYVVLPENVFHDSSKLKTECDLSTNYYYKQQNISKELRIINEDVVPYLPVQNNNNIQILINQNTLGLYGPSTANYIRQWSCSTGTAAFEYLSIKYDTQEECTNVKFKIPTETNAIDLQFKKDSLMLCAVQANGGNGASSYFKGGVAQYLYNGGGGGSGAFCAFLYDPKVNTIEIKNLVFGKDVKFIRLDINIYQADTNQLLYTINLYGGDDAPVIETTYDAFQKDGIRPGLGGAYSATDYSDNTTLTGLFVKELIESNTSITFLALCGGSDGGYGAVMYDNNTNAADGTKPDNLPCTCYINQENHFENTYANNQYSGGGGMAYIQHQDNFGQGGRGAVCHANAEGLYEEIISRTVGTAGRIILTACN